MMVEKFSGCSVAIVTPMRDDGAIDNAAFADLLRWHIAETTDCVVVAGTTGESPTLAVAEHQTLIARAAQIANAQIPIIAGVGANATAEAVSLTQRAAADGADAGLSVVPYYNKPTQEGLYRHFAAIAASSDLPLILYDIPGRCVVGLADQTVTRLARDCPTIIGIKDATADTSRVATLRAALTAAGRDDFLLLSGDDATTADFILAGGDGVISVTANIAPRKMRAMVAAARAGDADAARALDADLRAFHSAQSVEVNPIPVKAALAQMGKIAGGDGSIRLPLHKLSAQYTDVVNNALQSALV